MFRRCVLLIVAVFASNAESQYYGRRVPCPNSIMDPDGDCVPGVAGADYPNLASIPKTMFQCERQRVNYIGYFADTETYCQSYHVCQRDGVSETFLCPNGTVFNQQFLVCDWWFNVRCNDTDMYTGFNNYLLPPQQFNRRPSMPNVLPFSQGSQSEPVTIPTTTKSPPSAFENLFSFRSPQPKIEAVNDNNGFVPSSGDLRSKMIPQRENMVGAVVTPQIPIPTTTSPFTTTQRMRTRRRSTTAPSNTLVITPYRNSLRVGEYVEEKHPNHNYANPR